MLSLHDVSWLEQNQLGSVGLAMTLSSFAASLGQRRNSSIRSGSFRMCKRSTDRNNRKFVRKSAIIPAIERNGAVIRILTAWRASDLPDPAEYPASSLFV